MRRAIVWLVILDVVGFCVMWLGFSSFVFHGLGIDAGQAQKFVVPVGMALLVGVRIVSVSSLLGQVGLAGGFSPWVEQPWGLIPMPRAAIQRSLLCHIALVALIAIVLNLIFLAAWPSATEGMLWTRHHISLSGVVHVFIELLVLATGLMAMALMVVGTGMRNTVPLVIVAAGVMICFYLGIFPIPLPALERDGERMIVVILLTIAVWALSSKMAAPRKQAQGG